MAKEVKNAQALNDEELDNVAGGINVQVNCGIAEAGSGKAANNKGACNKATFKSKVAMNKSKEIVNKANVVKSATNGKSKVR